MGLGRSRRLRIAVDLSRRPDRIAILWMVASQEVALMLRELPSEPGRVADGLCVPLITRRFE